MDHVNNQHGHAKNGIQFTELDFLKISSSFTIFFYLKYRFFLQKHRQKSEQNPIELTEIVIKITDSDLDNILFFFFYGTLYKILDMPFIYFSNTKPFPFTFLQHLMCAQNSKHMATASIWIITVIDFQNAQQLRVVPIGDVPYTDDSNALHVSSRKL